MDGKEGVPRFLFGDVDLFGEPYLLIERNPFVLETDAAEEVISFDKHQRVLPFPEPTQDTRGNLMLPLDSGYQVE